MCRHEWGDLEKVEEEEELLKHIGVVCSSCKTPNFTGPRMRCLYCKDFNLCEACFAIKSHPHPFEKRETPTDHWEMVETNEGTQYSTSLPTHIAVELMNRDITPEDYDLLLQLDSPTVSYQPKLGFMSRNPLLPKRKISEEHKSKKKKKGGQQKGTGEGEGEASGFIVVAVVEVISIFFLPFFFSFSKNRNCLNGKRVSVSKTSR